MESKGLKVNADKTETMVYARTAEPLQIKDKTDKALKQVKNFRYLGSVIHAQGGSEEDIKARIAAAWKKWKDLSGVCVTEECPLALKREARLRWYGHVQWREEDDCQKTDLGGKCRWTTEQRKTEKEMDRRRQVQHGGLAAQRGGCKESS